MGAHENKGFGPGLAPATPESGGMTGAHAKGGAAGVRGGRGDFVLSEFLVRLIRFFDVLESRGFADAPRPVL